MLWTRCTKVALDVISDANWARAGASCNSQNFGTTAGKAARSMTDPAFPRGGHQSQGGANILFGIMFAKNFMKMRTTGLRGGARDATEGDS